MANPACGAASEDLQQSGLQEVPTYVRTYCMVVINMNGEGTGGASRLDDQPAFESTSIIEPRYTALNTDTVTKSECTKLHDTSDRVPLFTQLCALKKT